MVFSSVPAWLQALEQRHPLAIELGLERVGQVARRLDLLHWDIPVITVAGTNGKGSTVATLRAVAAAAGWRAGVYTSPHLLRFHERMVFAGEEIRDDQLHAALEAVEAARGDVSLTYFEHTTLAAFWWFRQCQPDLLILEIGLGGRLDVVNLIDPTVAVITSVDLDHQAFLGDTRAEIAREKAGIVRDGRPVVLGESDPEPGMLAQIAARGCPVWQAGRDFSVRDTDVMSASGRGMTWCWQGRDIILTDLPRPAVALANAATALAALAALAEVGGPQVTVDAVRAGLAGVQLAGRCQRLPGQPEVWLDVGHNPHGVRFLWQQLPAPRPGQDTHAVLAMLADKDIPGVIAASRGHVRHWWLAGLDVPRGASAQLLAECLQNAGLTADGVHETVQDALQAARQQAREGDRIVVFGSFHTVGAVLAIE